MNTYKIPNMVTVYPNLVPSFNVDSAAICSLPTSNFHNTSTGDGSLSYTWKFGGAGDTSNATNPSHKYRCKGYLWYQPDGFQYLWMFFIHYPNRLSSMANYSADFTTANSYCPGNTILFINKSTPAPSASPYGLLETAEAESVLPMVTTISSRHLYRQNV